MLIYSKVNGWWIAEVSADVSNENVWESETIFTNFALEPSKPSSPCLATDTA